MRLAPAGYLDTLTKQGALNFRVVDLVGYGVVPNWDEAGPTTFAFDGKRRSGTSVITGLGKAFVKLQQNNGIGTGSGLCFGDSGSPQIDPATNRVISVTTGGNGPVQLQERQLSRGYAPGQGVSQAVPDAFPVIDSRVSGTSPGVPETPTRMFG